MKGKTRYTLLQSTKTSLGGVIKCIGCQTPECAAVVWAHIHYCPAFHGRKFGPSDSRCVRDQYGKVGVQFNHNTRGYIRAPKSGRQRVQCRPQTSEGGLREHLDTREHHLSDLMLRARDFRHVVQSQGREKKTSKK